MMSMMSIFPGPNELLAVAGGGLVLCAVHIFERAKRCEVSVRALLASLIGLTGALAVQLAVDQVATWPMAVATAVAALITAVAVGTRTGRRHIGLDRWGMTQPDELRADEPDRRA